MKVYCDTPWLYNYSVISIQNAFWVSAYYVQHVKLDYNKLWFHFSFRFFPPQSVIKLQLSKELNIWMQNMMCSFPDMTVNIVPQKWIFWAATGA